MRNSFVIGLLALLLVACEGKDLPEPASCINPPVLEVTEVRHPASCVEPDGKIEVATVNASGGLMYRRNDQAPQHSGVFENLIPGRHLIQVTDKKGCRDTVTIELVNAASTLSASVITGPNSSCLEFNGSLHVTGSSGSPPYEYRFGSGAFTTLQQYDNLAPGIFVLQVRDAAGCTLELAAEVTRLNTGISWQDDIKPIVTARCAKSGCHDGHSGRPALKTYAEVYSLRSQVRSRVASGSMPYDGPLLPDQKAMILCWLDDGAINN